METLEFLKPVLALVIWTCVMWIWMYALRLPAFNKAGIKPDDARHPGTYADKLPATVARPQTITTTCTNNRRSSMP